MQRYHWSWFVLPAPPISKRQVPLDAVRSRLHNGPITIKAAFNLLNCNAANFSGSPSALKRAKNEPRRNSAHCDSFDRSTAVGQFRLCNVPSFQFVGIVHIAIICSIARLTDLAACSWHQNEQRMNLVGIAHIPICSIVMPTGQMAFLQLNINTKKMI